MSSNKEVKKKLFFPNKENNKQLFSTSNTIISSLLYLETEKTYISCTDQKWETIIRIQGRRESLKIHLNGMLNLRGER